MNNRPKVFMTALMAASVIAEFGQSYYDSLNVGIVSREPPEPERIDTFVRKEKTPVQYCQPMKGKKRR